MLTIGDRVCIAESPQVWRIVAERLRDGLPTPRDPDGTVWLEYQLEAKLPGQLRTTRVWHDGERLRRMP